MFKPWLIAACLALCLAGCIASDNPLPLESVVSFRLTDVAVSFPPGAHLNYPRAENEYAATKGVSSGEFSQVDALAQTPQGAEYVRSRAAAKMQDVFRQDVGSLLHGTHPVRVDVQITEIVVPGVVYSVVLGGTATLVARISLIDAANGQVLFTLPKQAEFVRRGGGILGTVLQSAIESGSDANEPYTLLCQQLAKDYGDWLFKPRRAGQS